MRLVRLAGVRLSHQPLPASVTPTSASKRHGRRQKVRELAVFLDRQAIRIAGFCQPILWPCARTCTQPPPASSREMCRMRYGQPGRRPRPYVPMATSRAPTGAVGRRIPRSRGAHRRRRRAAYCHRHGMYRADVARTPPPPWPNPLTLARHKLGAKLTLRSTFSPAVYDHAAHPDRRDIGAGAMPLAAWLPLALTPLPFLTHPPLRHKKPHAPHLRVSFRGSFTENVEILTGAFYFSAGARQNSSRIVRLDYSACDKD